MCAGGMLPWRDLDSLTRLRRTKAGRKPLILQVKRWFAAVAGGGLRGAHYMND